MPVQLVQSVGMRVSWLTTQTLALLCSFLWGPALATANSRVKPKRITRHIFSNIFCGRDILKYDVIIFIRPFAASHTFLGDQHIDSDVLIYHDLSNIYLISMHHKKDTAWFCPFPWTSARPSRACVAYWAWTWYRRPTMAVLSRSGAPGGGRRGLRNLLSRPKHQNISKQYKPIILWKQTKSRVVMVFTCFYFHLPSRTLPPPTGKSTKSVLDRRDMYHD